MLRYVRCPQDDMKAATASIGTNPKTGKSIEMGFHSIAATQSVYAAILAVSAAIKSGVEDDFIEKLVLSLAPSISQDPHSLCPMLQLFLQLMLLAMNGATVSFGKDERVFITPKGSAFDPSGPPSCHLENWNDETKTDDNNQD